MEKKAFAIQAKHYFGLNGKTMMEFAAELKALTHDDKVELAAALTAQGYPCDAPPAPQKAN